MNIQHFCAQILLTLAHWKRTAPIAARHARQFGCTDQRISIDARQLNFGSHFCVICTQFQATFIWNVWTMNGSHQNIDTVIMSSWSMAGEYTGIIFDRMENAQAIFQCIVTTLVCDPSIRIYSERVINRPFWIAKSSHPQAFHVQCCPWIHHQLSIVTLCDRAIVMAEQNCWRFFHCEKIKRSSK